MGHPLANALRGGITRHGLVSAGGPDAAGMCKLCKLYRAGGNLASWKQNLSKLAKLSGGPAGKGPADCGFARATGGYSPCAVNGADALCA
jgi:hypothetical protein